MADQDMAVLCQVIAVDRAQQRRLAHPGGTVQRHGFACVYGEIDGFEHNQPRAALVVQGEALGESDDAQPLVAHCRIDETRSCV